METIWSLDRNKLHTLSCASSRPLTIMPTANIIHVQRQ